MLSRSASIVRPVAGATRSLPSTSTSTCSLIRSNPISVPVRNYSHLDLADTQTGFEKNAKPAYAYDATFRASPITAAYDETGLDKNGEPVYAYDVVYLTSPVNVLYNRSKDVFKVFLGVSAAGLLYYHLKPRAYGKNMGEK